MFREKINTILPLQYKIAYDPDIIPPLSLMRQEVIDVLEEWFRWGEEWSMLLRVYGNINFDSKIMEIGCGLGRTAFPLRYLLSNKGAYYGFEIVKDKIDFLTNTFQKKYSNFNFIWADVHNTYYNPKGKIEAAEYKFPCEDNTLDIIFAASVFTHMLPKNLQHYFNESARALKKGGRCVFSFFILDYYNPGLIRPLGFSRPDFNFDNFLPDYGEKFATVVPDNPEQMTAYKLSFIEENASNAGLKLMMPPVPGIWSGTNRNFVGAQDIVVLTKE